jgi:hypothetical protein
MSNLTDLLPAGAGGKQVDFVASGTIGNGVTVALNSDGTVEAISSTGNPASAGTPVVFESGQLKSDSYPGSAFDISAGKIVIAYCDDDNSDAGTAVVGTIDPSDNSISFGTPVVFRATSTSGFDTMGVAYDANAGKVVITYRDSYDTGNGFAIVGTVSGTSISFGTQVRFNGSSPVFRSRVVYDSDSQKVVIVYRGANEGRAIVGTVSGTSISFGTEATFNGASTYWISPAYDTNAQRVVIAYQDSGNSNYGAAIVGTVSGTSISFGSEVVFESATTTNCSAVYDSNAQKIVIAYQDQGNSSYGTGIVGTVSGTSISFGSAATFESATTSNISIAYNTTAQKVGIAYQDGGNSNYGTIVTGSVSGTSITFDSPDVFESATTSLTTTVYDSTNNRFAIAYRDEGNSNQGTSAVYQTVGSNAADFIGISDAAISDTASGSVTIKGGISTNVTGLTANSTYYVQDDGSLSTTESDVLAGKALSSTSINLDYTT